MNKALKIFPFLDWAQGIKEHGPFDFLAMPIPEALYFANGRQLFVLLTYLNQVMVGGSG